jgi:glucose/mannose transport system substrate-binding protein
MGCRKRLALVGLLAGLAMLVAAGALPALGQPEDGRKELEIFSWWTAGGEAEGLSELYRQYSTRHPEVKIINATVAGGGGMNAKAVLVTRMQGRNPPDSFQVHAGHELIDTWVVAGKMEPITFIFEDLGYLQAYPRGLVDIISWREEIYSAPVNIHRSNVLWYNKPIFARHGLRAPGSIDELIEVCRKLSGAGITPLALGDNGIWAATHLFESVALACLGSEGYRGLWDGSTPWDSPEARQAIARFIGLLDYVNSDHAALSWDGAAQYVADGKAAMTVMGDWVEGYFKAKGLAPGEQFGWAASPGTAGSFLMLSDSFGLPKGAKHRAEAIDWVALCASREGQDAFNPKKGSIPARTDGDRHLYDAYLRSAMADFAGNRIVPSVTHGAAASEGWVNQINQVMSTLITEKNLDDAVAGFVQAAKAGGVALRTR